MRTYSNRAQYRFQAKIFACKVDMQAIKEGVEKYADNYQWKRARGLNVVQLIIHYGLKISLIKTLIHPTDYKLARHAF